jgi:hypothetical protein
MPILSYALRVTEMMIGYNIFIFNVLSVARCSLSYEWEVVSVYCEEIRRGGNYTDSNTIWMKVVKVRVLPN